MKLQGHWGSSDPVVVLHSNALLQYQMHGIVFIYNVFSDCPMVSSTVPSNNDWEFLFLLSKHLKMSSPRKWSLMVYIQGTSHYKPEVGLVVRNRNLVSINYDGEGDD